MLDQGMDGKGKERMEGMGYGGGKRGGLDMVGGGVEEVVGKASLIRRSGSRLRYKQRPRASPLG